MLTQVCQYLRNWFERTKYLGDFKISSGVLTRADGNTLPLLLGQYYRIIGSVLNDGVHQRGNDSLTDEDFSGAVWSMAVPPIVLELVADIQNWVAANESAINNPYQSESFGGYSYSKGYNSGTKGSSYTISWQSQFETRLNPWRKI